jgi:hypothetical protein
MLAASKLSCMSGDGDMSGDVMGEPGGTLKTGLTISNQPYLGATVILPTKHAKSLAVALPFWSHLKADVLEYVTDTDQLGTFSGEVERSGNALECARRKCEWGFELPGDRIEYCLASEGSFGPHPLVPFLARDQEILYFIDRRLGFHLHMGHASEKTNYQMKAISTLDELQEFAMSARFPSHALVLRPNDRSSKDVLFKGIVDNNVLKRSFEKAMCASRDGLVWAETDMRAQFNPMRMAVISELADKMARRLATLCPSCEAPGWGISTTEKGLVCEGCGQATDMILHENHGCVLCSHTETLPRSDGLQTAPRMYCQYCNP